MTVTVPQGDRKLIPHSCRTPASWGSAPSGIEQLRAKPGGERITVVEGDFATAKVDGEYGLAFVSSRVLFALTTQDLQVRCFENAASYLIRGGVFVIEAMAPQSRSLETAVVGR